MNVLIDANAFLAQPQFRIDLFAELTGYIGAYEPLVLDCVLEEMRRLATGQGKEGSSARYALLIAGKCKVVDTSSLKGSVDEKILYFARTHGCMVVTNDRDLRNALLSHGVQVISVAGRQRLELYRN